MSKVILMLFCLCFRFFFLGGISFQGSNQSWSKLTSDLWPQPDIHQDSQNSQQIAVEQQQQENRLQRCQR